VSNSFDEIIGQEAAVDTLRRLLTTGRVPHALLFRGPESVGKASAARLFAAALFCDGEGLEACGCCRSCRALASSSHPDFTCVEFEKRPSDGELRKEIVIDQIRNLNHLAGVAPRQAPHRLFLIDPADRMNREAQNGLLKTLEEPPGRAVLILVASRPHVLLPTVRSRCFSVGFSRLSPVDLTTLLSKRGLSSAESQARAALAGGRPGTALELDLESMSERREELLQMLEALATPSARELGLLPAMAADLAGKDETYLVAGLELLQSLSRDTAISAAAPGSDSGLVHLDLARRLAALAPRVGSARAAKLVGAIDQARGYLRINVNRTLLAESLLAEFATSA
jgi:DNA polymerase-3 subunit delta'